MPNQNPEFVAVRPNQSLLAISFSYPPRIPGFPQLGTSSPNQGRLFDIRPDDLDAFQQNMDNPTIDDHYVSQLDSGLESALEKLEPEDKREARAPGNAEVIRGLTDYIELLDESKPIKHAVSIIKSSLGPFEVFHSFLEAKFGSSRLQAAGIWGMVYLTLKLASELSEPENRDVMRQLSAMIKKLGQRVDLFNEYVKAGDSKIKQMTRAALDVHLELVEFFAASIVLLREHSPEPRTLVGNQEWMKAYNKTLSDIDSTFHEIEKLTQLAKRQASEMELQKQQKFLSISTSSSSGADVKLPCFKLPPAKDARFYDRDNITERIDQILHPIPGQESFVSIVLYGIGGVGKTHVALKYAHMMITSHRVKAVLWFNSETETALQQSFTEAAVTLGLPQAGSDRHQENRISLLSWLQSTETPWLVIFDNLEDPKVVEGYWPSACSHGSAIITSRNHNLRFHLADQGIEVPAFDQESGSEFLLYLLRMDVSADIGNVNIELESARELSEHLSGHALAISFMAGLISERSWTIKEFLAVYEKNRRKLHNLQRGPVALTTIWQLSFNGLGDKSAALLGILAYINPDAVPEEIFTKADVQSLPPCLQDCTDEWRLSGVLEPLLTLALIQRDKEAKALSIHRMVQTHYRYFLGENPTKRQEAFDQAVRILFDGFGKVESQLYDRWAQCQKYIQQIVSLKNNFQNEVGDPDAPHPTLQFCWLLSNSARFLLETANYLELESFVEVAESSFQRLGPEDKSQGDHVLADILDGTGLLWAHRGFFLRAVPHIRECNRLRSVGEPKDWVAISWSQVDLGNVLASAGAFSESLEWQLKAEKSRSNLPANDDNIKSSAVIDQNIGRCYTFLNDHTEAENRLDLARKAFEGSHNWAMLAYTLFVEGTLQRRRKRHQEAKAAYSRAQEVWLLGGKLKTHHFNGACMYKLGCVAYDLGERDDAIRHLREAMVVVKLKETVMTGDYARVLFKLSSVLAQQPGCEVEAAELAAEALRIRLGRPPSVLSNVSGEAGESLVSSPGVPTATPVGSSHDSEERASSTDEEKPYDDMVYILWR